MKRHLKCLLAGVLAVSLSSVNLPADLEVSASVQIRAAADFHAPLTPYGTWIEVGRYGRCWRPARVAVGWRPYCHGQWIWTDCGWYWVSDEPWAWACYHYGWWVHDSVHGWIWIPGVEWAPAWVSWRFGGGYCGWAPLAPRGVLVAPQTFVFVEVGHFHRPVRPATVIVNNTTIINKTTVVGGTKHKTRILDGATTQKVVVNEGPGVDAIRKATGKTVKAVPIREAVSRTPVPSGAANEIKRSQKNANPEAAPNRKLTPGSDPNHRDAPSQSPRLSPPGKDKNSGGVGGPASRPPTPNPPVPNSPDPPAEKAPKSGKEKHKDNGKGRN